MALDGVKSAMVASAIALAMVAACATGKVVKEDDDTTSTTSSTGGVGGTGSGGAGGSTANCPIDCSTIATPDCQVSQCNTATQQCEIVPDTDGKSCDDGVFCTVDDSCSNGTCVGGPQNDCGMNHGDCDQLTCDETTQTCSVQALPDGSACVNSQDLCQTGSTCLFGTCQGTPKDCFFFPVPDDCHVAQCNPMNGMCEAVVGNEGQPCVDPADLCTDNKTCASGVCQGGAPKDCSALTFGCQMGVCDTASGQCGPMAIMNGQTCNDGNNCTTGETCTNGNCSGGTPTTTCVGGDFCCPSNCDETNDTDCLVDTVLVFEESTASWGQGVVSTLMGTSLFTSVTLWDYDTQGLPTLTQLNNYDAVLAWTDGGVPAATQTQLGDLLADFYDGGGVVVTATFATCGNGNLGITGRWQSQGYTLMTNWLSQAQPSGSLGTINEPLSPIMAGVNTLSMTAGYRCPGTPAAGATVVAQWNNGDPMVIRGTKNGRNRVDLNFFPPPNSAYPGGWIGDGAALLANALLYQ